MVQWLCLLIFVSDLTGTINTVTFGGLKTPDACHEIIDQAKAQPLRFVHVDGLCIMQPIE